MVEERRKSRRVVIDVPARLTVGNETVEGRVRDICRDAALVVCDRSYPVDTRVVLETELPKVPGSIRMTGKVVRLAPGEPGSYGMALLFEPLPADTALRIDLFVSDISDTEL